MKTLIFKSLLVVGIILGIANYFLYLKTGTPPINSLPKVDLSSYLPDTTSVKDVISSTSSSKEKVYQWTDENGKTHYSTQLPSDQIKAKEMLINPDVNVVKRLATATKESTQHHSTSRAQHVDTPSANQAHSPDAVNKLIEDAKQVQTLVNERNQQLERVTGAN